MQLELTVNGVPQVLDVEPRRLLADVIRHDLGLRGCHLGCEHGVCGACTILLDDRPVRACLMLALQASGSSVTTIEGLADGDRLHPVQQAFIDAGGLQCGFCTPAFVLTVVDLLARQPRPDEALIREELSGNICRCTGYDSIVAAVTQAAQETSA